MKGKPNMRFHTCCGKTKRSRLVEWIVRRVGLRAHKCSDARDMAGVDWMAVKAEVNPEQKESD